VTVEIATPIASISASRVRASCAGGPLSSRTLLYGVEVRRIGRQEEQLAAPPRLDQACSGANEVFAPISSTNTRRSASIPDSSPATNTRQVALSHSSRSLPLNEHWRAAGELARIILNQDSLRDETGGVMGMAFTVDVNELFERFVERIVDREARSAGLQPVPQATRQLSTNVSMRPDLVLQSAGSDLAVGDAKYKT
jgi:hypothetical protein